MSHSTHVISLSPQAKWYVLILIKYLIPPTCLKYYIWSDDKTNIKNPYAESDLSSTAGKEIKPDEE